MSAGGHENCEYQNINSYLTYTSLVQTSVSILKSLQYLYIWKKYITYCMYAKKVLKYEKFHLVQISLARLGSNSLYFLFSTYF